MDDKIKTLSKGRTGKILIEVLENVKSQIADIRTELKVKENQNEIRLGVIQVLDEFLIQKIKTYGQEIEPYNPSEFI